MPQPDNADVRQEGDVLDIDKSLDRLSEKQDKEDKPASESQPEKKEAKVENKDKKPDDKKPDDEDPDSKLPFHQHPRWKKMQDDLKEARANGEKVTELEARIREYEDKSKADKPLELPKWWVDAYGDDEKSQTAYKNYTTATQAERDRIIADVTKSVTESLTKEQREAQEGEKYVETQLSEMEGEGLKFDRNVLLKFMVDFQAEYGSGSLLDAEGNYDFRKGLKLMEKMSPPQEDKSGELRKKIAGDTMRNKTRTAPDKEIPTVSSRALRRGNWRDAPSA